MLKYIKQKKLDLHNKGLWMKLNYRNTNSEKEFYLKIELEDKGIIWEFGLDMLNLKKDYQNLEEQDLYMKEHQKLIPPIQEYG